MLQRCFAHQTPAFDAPMVLRDRERIGAEGMSRTFGVALATGEGVGLAALFSAAVGAVVTVIASIVLLSTAMIMRVRARPQEITVEARFFADRARSSSVRNRGQSRSSCPRAPAKSRAAITSSRRIGFWFASLVVSVTAILMRSPVSTPRCFAIAGLIKAALSHVSFVIGSGNSWSQPLLM